jgi:hypothetical protein
MRSARSVSAFALGIVLLAAGLSAPPRVAAAPPPLRISAQAVYEVRPASEAVHVTIDATATDMKPDPADGRYYYTSAVLVVLGGATNFAATAGGAPASVVVREREVTHTAVEVAFNRSIFFGQSTRFHLEFDLPTGAGVGQVRVGRTLAAFPVWAVGTQDTPGSTVSIAIPPDYALVVQGETLPDPAARADGNALYEWTSIEDPATFAFFVTADLSTIGEDAFVAFTDEVRVGSETVLITVKAWADDQPWGQRTLDRLTEAMPLLSRLIGVRYFGTPRLNVRETVSRTLGGYAGIFDTSLPADEIAISYNASEAVTLHEAAHAWFNASLADERWMLEGFAEYYGELASRRLGITPNHFAVTPRLKRVAFPLAEWGVIGSQGADAEFFAYAASVSTVRQLIQRAGLPQFRAVLVAMKEEEAAYQPKDATVPETMSATADWRYLLDLLDERTKETYDDIFLQWVVPERDEGEVRDRAQAREKYVELYDESGTWDIPSTIRRWMINWAFDRALDGIEEAQGLLDRRDELHRRADDLGLQLPDDMFQDEFEGGVFARIEPEADAADAALVAYDGAQAADDGEDLVETAGLLGEDPDAHLRGAAAAIESGDLDTASSEAEVARRAWADARQNGLVRLAAVGGGTLLVILLVGSLIIRRGRRRAPPSTPGLPPAPSAYPPPPPTAEA